MLRTEQAGKRSETDKDKAAAPPAPAVPRPRAEMAPMAARESDVEDAAQKVEHRQPDRHLPDIGEFIGRLPEAPVIPAQRATAEQSAAPERLENESPAHAYPMETVADIPEWPENDQDTVDPPLQPVPPRQSPAFAAASSFETPAPGGAEDDKARVPAAVAGTAGGGGGSLPPTPPPRAGGPAPAPGGQPPSSRFNALYGSGGGGGMGYNPNVAPKPVTSSFEAPAPIVIQKKGNIWPYVAVLAENIARKRADRKIKKEFGGRMDQQDKAQEAANANQLRLEQQQREMIDQQRRQAIRDARRPSGHEWGVPQYPSAAPGGAVPGQRLAGERPLAGQRPEAVPGPVPGQEQQFAENVEQPMLQPHQHVEHSAWHNIVVNEKGHEVAGAMQYGEGFKRERQQEIIRDRTGDGVAAGVAGGGGSGGGQSGAPYYGQSSSYSHTLPSGMTTPGLPGGLPTHVDPQHQLPPHTPKKPTAHMPGPLFWLMVSLIIVAFFAAAFI